MKMELIQPFINAADAVLAQGLQCPMSVGNLSMEEETYRRKGVAALVSLTGDIEGRIIFDLDPETERRALSEGERLQTLYRTVTPQRLWRGAFTRPVGGTEPGSGFGSRRIINGKPRMPHGGIDYAAPTGTPVVAVNAGRVALVADFFFPGRLVAVDHGLGLYTLYFHLDSAAVSQGDMVERGQTIGTVGATGRATGPHLPFGAPVAPGSAAIAGCTRLKMPALPQQRSGSASGTSSSSAGRRRCRRSTS